MTSRAILLDTNFFIYLLQDSSSLNENANKYFKYFCEHNIKMKISTVSIAEYCAGFFNGLLFESFTCTFFIRH